MLKNIFFLFSGLMFGIRDEILVQNGGQIIIDNNSLIEDAKIAINFLLPVGTANTNTIISVQNSIFNKNGYGIRISNYQNTTGNYPFTIRIYQEITIGSGVAEEYNVIDNHIRGISALNSNFTCYNTVFQNDQICNLDLGLDRVGVLAVSAKNIVNNRCRIIPFTDNLGNIVKGTHNRFYDYRCRLRKNI